MGISNQYFVAADNAAAARTVGNGGLGRGLLDSILGPDPVVELTALEGFLRGLDEEESLALIDRPDCGDFVGGDPDAAYVVTVARGTVDALAFADDGELAAAVGRWSRIEEFGGLADPEVLLAIARDLRAMFSRADADGTRPYVLVNLV
ncbi:hypothetical protein WKY82_00290 [Gordonia malaquae]|uniref:hypothetical protein n=1 Tax=Gordonia malaquae TaxID=410332 RepID=UPI0030C7911A